MSRPQPQLEHAAHRRNDRARARRHERRCRLRPGAHRPAVPGARLGDRERKNFRPHRRDEHRGERPRRSRGAQVQAHEDHGCAARCPAAEEHRHHRRDSRTGNREVREARRRHRVARPDYQPGTHSALHRHLRAQVPGRGDLLAAPALEAHHVRDGSRDARGDQPPGRARGSVPVHRETQRARSRSTSWRTAISRSRPAANPWCERPTARGGPRTASAPATRPW